MRELILSVCQKSKDSFREKKTGIEADGRLLGAGHQWAPMGEVFFLLGSSTDVTEKKRKHIRWALGAAGQEKLSDHLDSKRAGQQGAGRPCAIRFPACGEEDVLLLLII